MSSVKHKRRVLDDKIGKEVGSNTILFKLDNGRRYAHTATSNYLISMASLQPDDRRQPNCACSMINKSEGQDENANKVTVIIEHDLKEHILCILDSKRLNQCKLNLHIQEGEQVAYRATGKIPVQLTGVIEAH